MVSKMVSAQNIQEDMHGLFLAWNRTTVESESEQGVSIKPNNVNFFKIGYLKERTSKRGITLETGVMLKKTGYEYELKGIPGGYNNSLHNYSEGLTTYYLELPVNLKKSFQIDEKSRFFIKGGLALNLLLYTEFFSRKDYYTLNRTETQNFHYHLINNLKNDPNSNYINIVDLEFVVSIGFKMIAGSYLLEPQVGYQYGVQDIIPGEGTMKNREITIGITIGNN